MTFYRDVPYHSQVPCQSLLRYLASLISWSIVLAFRVGLESPSPGASAAVSRRLASGVRTLAATALPCRLTARRRVKPDFRAGHRRGYHNYHHHDYHHHHDCCCCWWWWWRWWWWCCSGCSKLLLFIWHHGHHRRCDIHF